MNRGFESFYIRWFIGPAKDFDVRRELGHTIGAKEKDRPGFSRNKIVNHIMALPIIKEFYGKENLYISIAFYDVEEKLLGYHYLYYDFDYEENPELAIRKGLEFAKSIKARYGAEPVTYLSGHKGLGVLIVLKNYVDWETYRLLWRTLIQPYNYDGLIDTKVCEPRRLHRIPFTYNIKPGVKRLSKLIDLNGRLIEPRDFDWDLYQPLDPGEVTIYQIKVEPVFKKVVVHPSSTVKKPLPSRIEDLTKSNIVPPCIRNIVETMVKSGDIDHYARLALVWYLKWIGFSVEDVIGFFKRHARDYNERITRYQVEYAYGLRGSRKDYVMYSCRKMKEIGLCLECGWDRNPVTYTYTKAQVPEDIKQRFFSRVKAKIGAII